MTMILGLIVENYLYTNDIQFSSIAILGWIRDNVKVISQCLKPESVWMGQNK